MIALHANYQALALKVFVSYRIVISAGKINPIAMVTVEAISPIMSTIFGTAMQSRYSTNNRMILVV
jgi:hypothetical protein